MKYAKWEDAKRVTVLSWAQNAVTTHDNVIVFLKGTIISSSVYCSLVSSRLFVFHSISIIIRLTNSKLTKINDGNKLN